MIEVTLVDPQLVVGGSDIYQLNNEFGITLLRERLEGKGIKKLTVIIEVTERDTPEFLVPLKGCCGSQTGETT